MRSNIFFLLPALTVLAACSENNESVGEKDSNAVSFETFVSPQGRGVAASQDANANLQQNFGVFVYRNADGEADALSSPNTLYNEKVTYTPGNGFSYANTIYWPVNDKLGFYAYSPYYTDNAPSGISEFVPENNTTPGLPGFTFAVNSDTNKQIDLLVAKAEGLSGGVVSLPFTHALSRVEVQAHTSGVNYRVAIMDIKLKGIYSVGKYTFIKTTATWSNQSTEAEYTGVLDFTGTSDLQGAGQPAVIVLYNNNAGNYTNVTDPGNSLYLLPQLLGANAQLVVTYNIRNVQNGNLVTALDSQELTIDLSNANSTLNGLVQWGKSQRIIYRLNFIPRESGPGSEVKFEATVTDWSVEYGDLS